MAVPQGFYIPFRMVKQRSSPNFVEGDAVLDRSIRTIIRTFPGERPYRPTFGSLVRALIFTNMTEGAALQGADEIRRALLAWEPRISVVNILFELNDTSVFLTVIWRANGRRQDSTTLIEFRT